MAGVVSCSSAIKNLVQDVERDADLPPVVKDEVRSFQAELKKVVSFLSYSESNLNEQEMAGLEIEVRDVAYAAEDTIEEFMLNRVQQMKSSRRRWRKLGMVFLYLNHNHQLRNRDATASMEGMKQRLRRIHTFDKHRSFDGGDGGGSRGSTMSMTVEEPDLVVGFDSEVEGLVKLLTEEDDELQQQQEGRDDQLLLRRRQDVVSIVGIDGLGKTTLAKKIYNNGAIRAHFDYQAWVHVPREYETAELLRCTLKSIVKRNTMDRHQEEKNDQEHDEENEEELKEAISKCLRGLRYLIVMDNVWRKEVWDEVKSAFPDDSNGSRILLTTRLEEVASHASTKPPHKPGFLCNEDSWELLRRKALGEELRCPPDLETIGRQIARKCDGLPLAIVLLGGILARKEKTADMWLALANNSNKYLMIEGKRGRDIALSYHNLPPGLKMCFLYFGMFPEDFKIPARQLVQLWIAEGFINEDDQEGARAQMMEDVGEKYLEELVGQSLIQVDSRRMDGGAKTCSIRNLFRELCVCIAEERNHFLVRANPTHVGGPLPRDQAQPPRLAIHGDGGSLMEALLRSHTNYKQLRSLQCYDTSNTYLAMRLWRALCSCFGSLRVLNLGSIKVDKIPKGVKKLLYLHYMRLNAPNLMHIPHSVCNLEKLQTLDMRESSASTLPSGIWKMNSLRHLYFRSASLPYPRGSNYDRALCSLQTLSGVRPDAVLKRLMVKAKFPNVRKLSLCSTGKQASLNFLESLDHLYHLRSLKIVNACELPDPNVFPLTLTKITLKQTVLDSQSMQKLEKLPNLRILKLLENSVVGSEINCNAGGFPQLQVLQLVKLEAETWNIGRGAMRNIQHLVIRECARLVSVSRLLPCMDTLREVELFNPSAELKEAFQQLGNRAAGCKIQFHPES